ERVVVRAVAHQVALRLAQAGELLGIRREPGEVDGIRQPEPEQVRVEAQALVQVHVVEAEVAEPPYFERSVEQHPAYIELRLRHRGHRRPSQPAPRPTCLTLGGNSPWAHLLRPAGHTSPFCPIFPRQNAASGFALMGGRSVSSSTASTPCTSASCWLKAVCARLRHNCTPAVASPSKASARPSSPDAVWSASRCSSAAR